VESRVAGTVGALDAGADAFLAEVADLGAFEDEEGGQVCFLALTPTLPLNHEFRSEIERKENGEEGGKRVKNARVSTDSSQSYQPHQPAPYKPYYSLPCQGSRWHREDEPIERSWFA